MTVPPLDPRAAARIRQLARGDLPYAEIWRRVRPEFERRGLPVPSYGTVRRLVRDERHRLAHAPESEIPVEVQLYPGRIIVR